MTLLSLNRKKKPVNTQEAGYWPAEDCNLVHEATRPRKLPLSWPRVWPALVHWWTLGNAKWSRKTTNAGFQEHRRTLAYRIPAHGKKMTSHRINNVLVRGEGKGHMLADGVKFWWKHTPHYLLQMCYLLPPSSISHLGPRGHGWMDTGKAQDRQGVFFNRKNPNRSVNIIIYLSLQWWWKNVQMSSFNKV